MARSKKHHHNPEVLLKQFAEPLFGDKLQVFVRRNNKWQWEERTPNGIGHSKNLYTGWDDSGKPHDSFEQFLSKEVDDKCASALKKAATAPEDLDRTDFQYLAHFIAFAAARSRGIMEHAWDERKLNQGKQDDQLVKAWCKHVGVRFTDDSENQMLKTSLFKAVDINASKWRRKLLENTKWSTLKAPPETPLVTSDWPAAAETQGSWWILTFAVSSEVAFLVSNNPESGFPELGPALVRAFNMRTMARAQRFVACHQRSFPGDDVLEEWARTRRVA
jgi:hypothetical protein